MITNPDLGRREFLAVAGMAFAESMAAKARGGPPATQKQPMKEIQIQRAGSRPSTKGPAEWFTGAVRIDPLFQPSDPARTAAASVTFEPGARTAWHTHPLGQTLIITAGRG